MPDFIPADGDQRLIDRRFADITNNIWDDDDANDAAGGPGVLLWIVVGSLTTYAAIAALIVWAAT